MFENVSLFAGLSPDDIKVLEAHAVVKAFPRNALIVSEGDETDHMYIVREGRVKVFVSDEHGKELVLNNHGPGEYFGELALLDDAPRSASVMTAEATKCSVISRRNFLAALSENPSIAMTLITQLSQRVRELTEHAKNLALVDVYGRIAKTLRALAEPDGDKLVIRQRLTHKEIANRVGSSREMVTRILKDLVKGGYIVVEKDRIIVNGDLPAHW